MIIEKELGIAPDYQFKAYNSKNIIQRNWHRNKFSALWYLISKFGDAKDKTVFDLGTGSGNFELLFNDDVKKIIGADYNQEALDFLNSKITEKKINNVDTMLFDITNFTDVQLPKAFDYMIMIDVIEHIDIKHSRKLLTAIKNYLSKDGKIIIITPNYSSLWVLIEKLLDRIGIVPKFDKAQHIARFNAKSLKELFEAEGYHEVYASTINTLGYVVPIEKICQFINKIELVSKFKYGNLVISVFEKNS